LETHAARPRVVVTGMGLVTPLGTGLDRNWSALVAGTSSADYISRFDTTGYAVRFGCEVRDFDPATVMDYREARRFDRLVHYAVGAAHEAVAHAGLVVAPEEAERVGVVIGAGMGGLETVTAGFETLWSKGPMRVNPLTGAMMLPNMPAGQISITFGARGPNFSVASACATGANAVGEAFEIIRRGDADVMLAGATESGITPFGLAAFHRIGAMSTRNDDPKRASRPFDKDRDGFVFGEGSAVLVLENLDHARARGARPLAELAGYGATADAFHISAPLEDGSGAAGAIRRAIAKAGLRPEDVDHINAHGTSTPLNDLSETRAIKTVFGDHAYRMPITATKGMHGHLMSAAGAVEAAITVMTMLHGVYPPTINLETPDPECDLDYVPNQARQADRPIEVAISNSFGFGGHNACLLFRRYEPGS
jgi:3-oxoacyl-[acyl-carrier-protein] synthase II